MACGPAQGVRAGARGGGISATGDRSGDRRFRGGGIGGQLSRLPGSRPSSTSRTWMTPRSSRLTGQCAVPWRNRRRTAPGFDSMSMSSRWRSWRDRWLSRNSAWPRRAPRLQQLEDEHALLLEHEHALQTQSNELQEQHRSCRAGAGEPPAGRGGPGRGGNGGAAGHDQR